MFNPEKKIGASLLVLGMMISGRAMAQAETTPTCVKAPTCEELGYDKVASDCGELAKLRCPFAPDKYFCTAYTDQNGKNWRKSAISYMLTQFRQNRFRAVFRSVSFMTSAAR